MKAKHKKVASDRSGSETPYAEKTPSPRQMEVLRRISQGMTSGQIAMDLDISVRTVEVHRFLLMHRLGVRSVVGLLRKAIEMKLLPRQWATI